MNEKSQHDRAHELLALDLIEGISTDERRWLDRHLTGCPECSTEARLLGSAVTRLRSFSPTAEPDLVRQTKLAVHRARQVKVAERSAPLWIAVALSSISMILTSVVAWRVMGWLGQVTDIPEPVWQVAFLTWWFLPAAVVAAALSRHHAVNADSSDWGQS